MGKIRKLPPEIISKIAAGEVIERPCYAVKELIENSLDAGADDIKINIEQAGIKKIQIIDNGEGMDEEDLKKCYLPNTTSKLIDDSLMGIKSLGFRGEALASITAISDVKIVTRKKENLVGETIEISKGKIIKEGKSGAPVGTSITVENLFASVPARKKFLKSLRTEYRHTLDIITRYALAYPNVRFEVYNNGKLVFDLPGNGNFLERVKNLLGMTIYENLIPIKQEESYVKISGFIGKPQIASSTTARQHLFVNNRWVSDSLVSSAVKDVYGGMVEPLTYPIFFLFLDLPYEMIDVNVHPRKEQINFFDNQFIFNVVQQAVNQTLKDNNLTFFNLSWKNDLSGSTNSYLGSLLKEEVLGFGKNDLGKIDYSDVLQIHNLYLICPSKYGLVLFDQHAAHERVMYEKFLSAFQQQKAKKESCQLEKAILLELTPSDTEVLNENITIFSDLGFIIEYFGETTFKIDSVPVLFKDWDIKKILQETIDDLRESGKAREVNTQTKKMLQYLACRSAIKAGDKLSKQEARNLLKELEKLDLAYTCPHGRPLKVEVSLSELDKLFKRR